MKRHILIIISIFLILVLVIGIRTVLATPAADSVLQASPLHPDFPLLDKNGENVLISGKAVSTMKTCGQCHDTDFIASHAFHADLGLSDYQPTTDLNAGPGTFGKWNPLTYRYLSQAGDERFDLGTPEWLMLFGDRVVGGGPATTSRSGQPLEALSPNSQNYETAILNKNRKIEAWDWNASGTMEMNCFLCHLEKPNNEARIKAIRAGKFGEANTATLLGLVVIQTDEGWAWNAEAFNDLGEVKSEVLSIQDPTNENCAACHGVVHTDFDVPLVLEACNWETATTGQVISPQRISESGMNIANKETLSRAWDIHAERQLQCTDCHFSPNNPARALDTPEANPPHLLYDPRTLEIGEYLQRPDHNFARGQSAQYNADPELKGTMRRCESCHDANKSHANWLPYIDRHTAVIACETCHIPKLYAPAIQTYDWTVIKTNLTPITTTCRGIEQQPAIQTAGLNIPMTVSHLVTGFEPVVLNRVNVDGTQLLAPYNLITSYYWVYEDANGNKRPVRLLDLEAVFLENGKYASDIVSVFDTNKDKVLTEEELIIDTPAKEEIVKSKLASLGLNNPHIEGLVQPYSINHNVARGEEAINDCKVCHSDTSRLAQPIKLSDYAPNGTLPQFDTTNNVRASGEIIQGSDGAIYYRPTPANDRLYLFGFSRVDWVDRLGALLFVGALLGVLTHGTLRVLSSRKQAKGHARTERIYMYESYRRFWHWLQSTSIVILLFTGLIIHRPDIFGVFSFRHVVTVHNVIAVLLVINAVLSLFYHLTTGRIREFIPRPYGFFDDAIVQAKYYLRGIFKGEPHPFEKRPDSRMNPIQKATYFMILNVLLPLQILTGALMWGVQKIPVFANALGGLPFLAPFHSFVAWMFGTFILVHIYMTTTGTTPLEAMRAMITGWEEVEVHEHHTQETNEAASHEKKKEN
ncbi:MAG TPA: cytochrome b/b6 domain-containing protein [Anaerolineales bacterium]|nr:cytochrome b/b6 domain-containing protein [Anaerolineales bacterium]